MFADEEGAREGDGAGLSCAEVADLVMVMKDFFFF